MFYYFDQNGDCVMSAPSDINKDPTLTKVESDTEYQLFSIVLKNGQIEKKPDDVVPENKKQDDIDTPVINIYRVAHGDFIPVPNGKNPSDFVYEILSVQVSGDSFNSPNVGMIIQPPQYPFYRDANITIGIVNINQAYVSNNETDPMKHITGWLTIKVNEKTNVPQDTDGQPLVPIQPSL